MATKMGMADLQLVDREGEDTQRVAVLDAPYRLSVRNALIPEPKADEVRVKILWVGICGSDLEAYRGTRAPEFLSIPARLGHEVSGIIDKVGDKVIGLKAGDKVTCRYVWGAYAQYIVCKPFHVKVLPPDFPMLEISPIEVLPGILHAAELGKIVSKETRLDILVTPGTSIISGVLAAQFIGPGVSGFMAWFGDLVKTATQMQPFLMGVLVSALIGIALTLPISSAAICIPLSLEGLTGGAATAGCCAQMIGFAFMSWQENKVGGLLAQGLGTSMLQMGNIVHNPRIWIPPTIVSMITGPLATMVFRLENIPAGSGMGTCGLVGPIGVFTAMGGGARMWLGILFVCFLIPAVLTPILGNFLRKIGWISDGDLKLDL